MRKFIYQSIVEKLQAEVPDIQHFGLWNNQLTYIQEEIPFALPAVFVEFRPIKWQHQGSGVRDAAVQIALHVLTSATQEFPFTEEPLPFFDLLTDINRALHRHSKSDEMFTHNAFTAVQSSTDYNSTEIRHDIEVFSCHATDRSAMPLYRKKTVSVKIDT